MSKTLKPYIYKLTLLRDTSRHKNGDSYIGQHNGLDENYWTGGFLPIRITKKHGRKVFKREVIVSGDFNKKLLNDLEIHYIRLFGTQIRGLNIASGGTYTKPPSPVHEYDLEGNYLTSYLSVNHTAKEKGLNPASVRAACNGSNQTHKGRQYRYYKKDKIKKIPKRNLSTKKVYQYNLLGRYMKAYKNVSEVCKKLGGSPSEVHACCKKHRLNKSFKGFMWSYEKLNRMDAYKTLVISKKINQYNLNGKYIASFDTIASAAKMLNKERGDVAISRAIDRNGSSYGFQWRTYKVSNCGEYVQYTSSKKIKIDTGK